MQNCFVPFTHKSINWRQWFEISWKNFIDIVAMVFPTVILLISVSVGFKTQTKITVLLIINNKYRLTGWNHLHLKTLTGVNNTTNQQTIAQFTAVCWPQYSADSRWSLSLLRFRRSWTKARLQRGFKIRRQSIGINQGINGLYKMLYLEDYLESKGPYLVNMRWLNDCF